MNYLDPTLVSLATMEYERSTYPDRSLGGYLRRHTSVANNLRAESREDIFTSSLPSTMLRSELASRDRNPRSTLKKQTAVEDEFIEDLDG